MGLEWKNPPTKPWPIHDGRRREDFGPYRIQPGHWMKLATLKKQNHHKKPRKFIWNLKKQLLKRNIFFETLRLGGSMLIFGGVGDSSRDQTWSPIVGSHQPQPLGCLGHVLKSSSQKGHKNRAELPGVGLFLRKILWLWPFGGNAN